ncbi:sensory box histidine kinase [Clostridium sporogenes]|nr:sensory box histidine kinase [Clostridium sporogenes]
MSEINQSREKNIYSITCIVKLVSLLFSSIILYNYLSQNNCTTENSYHNTVFAILLSLIMTIIYLIWSFFSIKTMMFKNILLVQRIENIFFLLIFTVMIIISGNYNSQYKYFNYNYYPKRIKVRYDYFNNIICYSFNHRFIYG